MGWIAYTAAWLSASLVWTLATAASPGLSPVDTLPYALLAMGFGAGMGVAVWHLTGAVRWDWFAAVLRRSRCVAAFYAVLYSTSWMWPDLLGGRAARPGLTPDQIQERRAKAVATNQRGIELARKAKGKTIDPLEPAWGEPELLINLAWSKLKGTRPAPRRAEAYARVALALVPHWRYVRDILLPQVRHALNTQVTALP